MFLINCVTFIIHYYKQKIILKYNKSKHKELYLLFNESTIYTLLNTLLNKKWMSKYRHCFKFCFEENESVFTYGHCKDLVYTLNRFGIFIDNTEQIKYILDILEKNRIIESNHSGLYKRC